jgi:V/A-type H+-transporting ATPase subunit I
MIVEMRKILLYGRREELDHFFFLAQRAGFLEFIGLSHKKKLEMPEEAKTLLAAIKIAKQHDVHAAEAPSGEPLQIASRMIGLYAEEQRLKEEERLLEGEIARVAIFGDFSKLDLEDVMKQSNRVIQFFCMKSDLAHETPLSPELIYIGNDFDLDYFVAIHKESVHYPKMIEIKIERPVGELRERQAVVQTRISDIEREIRGYSHALPALQQGLVEWLNDYHLRLAKNDAALPLDGSIFAIEAWVPVTKLKALEGLLSSLSVEVEEIAVESADRVPTCMENRGSARLGEDLVHVYDTPSFTDKDPSMWILVFFSIFFAMIVCDTGYGLFYLSIVLLLKWKLKKASAAVRRFLKLGIIMSCACIAWGIVTASYFGIEIGPDNPLRKTSFIDYLAGKKAEYHIRMQDDVYQEIVSEYPAAKQAASGQEFLLEAHKVVGKQVTYPVLDEFYGFILLEFSLLLGSVHIILSLLRYVRRNWSHLGWVLFIIGGYLWFPKFVNATSLLNYMDWISKPVAYGWGEWMLYSGLGLFCVIGFLEKKWAVFADLPNALQIFSDVLSYLRLYALSLAGVIMAKTFNTMAIDVGLFPGGLFVLLAGHLINSMMTLMSGVIHGFRLNILEWYHYSFEGNGKLFNPLRIHR